MTLSPREREVCRYICEGLSNKQIATRLGLSTYTIKSHVHSVLVKLSLKNRVQIATMFGGFIARTLPNHTDQGRHG